LRGCFFFSDCFFRCGSQTPPTRRVRKAVCFFRPGVLHGPLPKISFFFRTLSPPFCLLVVVECLNGIADPARADLFFLARASPATPGPEVLLPDLPQVSSPTPTHDRRPPCKFSARAPLLFFLRGPLCRFSSQHSLALVPSLTTPPFHAHIIVRASFLPAAFLGGNPM